MFAYESLSRYPRAFRRLTGLSPADFASLLTAFAAAAPRLPRGRRTTGPGKPRQRAPGGGRRPDLDDRHRLLRALVWLRVYPTSAVRGCFFGLHQRNAQRNVRAVRAVLDTRDDFPFDRPGRDRTKLSSAAAVLEAFPPVRLVSDSKAQRVQRPGGGFDAQKPYYSGKKKTHTLTRPIAVRPDGRSASVSASVPGGATHDVTLLRETKLLDRWSEGAGARVDKGDDGIGTDYPDVPILLPYKARRTPPLTEAPRAFNRVGGRYRVVVEHALAQLHRFTGLRPVLRGGINTIAALPVRWCG